MIHRRVVVLSLLALLGAACAEENSAAGVPPLQNDGLQWGRVLGEIVNIRVTPDTLNQPVSTLRSGAYVRAKVAQNNWLEIEWPQDVPAWVLKDAIDVQATDAKIGSVRAARARIVSLGMTTAPELAVLERGARVSIVGQKGDWLQVQAPQNARAYIYSKYVVMGAEPPDAKLIECSEILVLQEEAHWPKSVPAMFAPAKKAEAKVVEEQPLVEIADLKKIDAQKRAEEELAARDRKRAEEELAAAERKRAEEAAPKPVTLELKNNRPLVLTESDFKNRPEPTEDNYCANGGATYPPPSSSTASKISEGPAVVEVTDANFEAEIANHKGAVLIDFFATWCGPCRAAAPVVEATAENLRGRVKFAKIDIDQSPAAARRFGISSIPCLILLNDGKTEKRLTGVPGREMLEGWVSGK